MNNQDAWAKEWKNAYNFFNTKGNIHTKSKLKDKWNKEFMEMLKSKLKEVLRIIDRFNFEKYNDEDNEYKINLEELREGLKQKVEKELAGGKE